jgi:peroxiredoxin
LVVATLVAALAFQGFLSLNLFRQNGRLLLRIEALETSRPQVAQAQPARTVPAPTGLPIGAKAISFDLPKVEGGRVALRSFLEGGKPLLLVFTDPKCGPCNSLLPEIASWQHSLAPDVSIVLLSAGEHDTNRAKAAEHELKNVLIDKNSSVAAKYKAFGTPAAVVLRGDGTIGSYTVGGADLIRQLVMHRGWTEPGFASFLKIGTQPQVVPPKPALPMGSSAPLFKLRDLDGKNIDLAALHGKPTVLLFWNAACGFCQRMLPSLFEWETRKQSDSPRLVLVSSSARQANVQMGLQSTVALDQTFGVGRLYGANGTPSAVLIDASGKIASTLRVGGPAVMELLDSREREHLALPALASAS